MELNLNWMDRPKSPFQGFPRLSLGHLQFSICHLGLLLLLLLLLLENYLPSRQFPARAGHGKAKFFDCRRWKSGIVGGPRLAGAIFQ